MPQRQSLTRAEAQARAELVEVHGYGVELDLDARSRHFRSRTTLTFSSGAGSTFVEIRPARLDSVTLDGDPIEVGLLRLGRLPLLLAPGRHELVVDAQVEYRSDGQGLHRSVDPVDGRAYVYAMCSLDEASSVFSCFDQPDLKASFTIRVRAPLDWVVRGNAPASRLAPGLWEIGPTPPIPTYVFTVVAGPYHLVSEAHDGISLGFTCRQSLATHLEADLEELVSVTSASLDELHRLFGVRYAFGDYHQAFVPGLNTGAMESAACITIRDSFVFSSRPSRATRVARAVLMAHELAHQWFGNLITPRWWDGLWLNESFAEFLGNRVVSEVTPFDDAWVTVAWSRRMWGLAADLRATAHPLAGTGAPDVATALQDFDGISYAKGATVLRQLAAVIGDDAFLAAAADVMRKRRFGTFDLGDLVEAWRGSGAADLDGFVRDWLWAPGVDILRYDRANGALNREVPAAHPADRRHTLRITALGRGTAGTSRHRVVGAQTTIVLPRGALVMDAGHETWALCVPDGETMVALVTELPRVLDPEVRAAVWNNIRSGYAIAEVDPDRVVDLLEADYPADDTIDLPWQRHLTWWVIEQVLPLASHGSASRVHRGARRALEAATPGSDLQLGALRASIHTAGDRGVLRGWLVKPPSGVDVDEDLRWRLLTRLAALGAADHVELEAALADADTATARLHRLRAVVSCPTPESKERAWQLLGGAGDLTAGEVEAAGWGLWQGGQQDLTEPYVARYATHLPALANRLHGWVAGLAAEVFFPATHTDPATLAATSPLLEPGVLPTAVRRRVADQVDLLERRLAVRAAFPRR